MPERYFDIRWPDGVEQSCYSPSSVVDDFFTPDQQYSLAEFMSLSEKALHLASEREKNKYGFYCSSAADQLAQLKARSSHFSATELVTVLRIHNG